MSPGVYTSCFVKKTFIRLKYRSCEHSLKVTSKISDISQIPKSKLKRRIQKTKWMALHGSIFDKCDDIILIRWRWLIFIIHLLFSVAFNIIIINHLIILKKNSPIKLEIIICHLIFQKICFFPLFVLVEYISNKKVHVYSSINLTSLQYGHTDLWMLNNPL